MDAFNLHYMLILKVSYYPGNVLPPLHDPLVPLLQLVVGGLVQPLHLPTLALCLHAYLLQCCIIGKHLVIGQVQLQVLHSDYPWEVVYYGIEVHSRGSTKRL